MRDFQKSRTLEIFQLWYDVQITAIRSFCECSQRHPNFIYCSRPEHESSMRKNSIAFSVPSEVRAASVSHSFVSASGKVTNCFASLIILVTSITCCTLRWLRCGPRKVPALRFFGQHTFRNHTFVSIEKDFAHSL